LISSVTDEEALRNYIKTIVCFGARAGQAQILLNNWIRKIGGVKQLKGGEYEITGLGADDLVSLAAGAWLQAEKITDTRIKRDLDRILSDKSPCRLAGNTSTVVCGAVVVELAAPPSMRVRSIDGMVRLSLESAQPIRSAHLGAGKRRLRGAREAMLSPGKRLMHWRPGVQLLMQQ